jgi:predicted TIM-barrel fold metal-dependent hydrolase
MYGLPVVSLTLTDSPRYAGSRRSWGPSTSRIHNAGFVVRSQFLGHSKEKGEALAETFPCDCIVDAVGTELSLALNIDETTRRQWTSRLIDHMMSVIQDRKSLPW